jgi:hypothetical protein
MTGVTGIPAATGSASRMVVRASIGAERAVPVLNERAIRNTALLRLFSHLLCCLAFAILAFLASCYLHTLVLLISLRSCLLSLLPRRGLSVNHNQESHCESTG